MDKPLGQVPPRNDVARRSVASARRSEEVLSQRSRSLLFRPPHGLGEAFAPSIGATTSVDLPAPDVLTATVLASVLHVDPEIVQPVGLPPSGSLATW